MILPTITDQSPEPFTFTLKGKRRRKYFFWMKESFSMQLTMNPMTLGTIQRVSRIMVALSKDAKMNEEDSVILHTNKLTAKHLSSIAEAIAITIEPRRKFQQKRLQRLILKNSTPFEMINLLRKAIDMMDMGNFLKSITYVMGLNIMPPGGRVPTAEEAAEISKSTP